MASKLIEDLQPVMQPHARAFKAACDVAGLPVLIYCTLRTLEEQAALYAQGRSVPGRKVTNAPPGSSAHNFGLALDAVPLWNRYGTCARLAGLEWAGDWTRFREFPHVQMPNWRNYT